MSFLLQFYPVVASIIFLIPIRDDKETTIWDPIKWWDYGTKTKHKQKY